jgi:sarcosine oxidase subunit beta
MQTCDALIVGAGLVGSALAYELTLRGVSVIVIEQGSIGGATSSINQGGIRQQFHDPINIQAGIETVRRMERFRDEFGVDPGFVQNGYLFFLSSPESHRFFTEAAARQNELGSPTCRLSPSEVKALVPGVKTDDLVGATYCPTDGYLDAGTVVRGYAAGATRAGAIFVEGVEVTELVTSESVIREVQTTGDRYSARLVVNAAGPWSAAVGRLYGATVPVAAHRSSFFFMGKRAGRYAPLPLMIDIDRRVTIRPHAQGVMVGSARKPLVRNPGWTAECDWPFMEMVTGRATHRIPALALRKVNRGRAAYWEVTPDDNPIIGWTNLQNVYTAAGFSGHGLSIIPGLIPSITRDMFGEKPEISLEIFRPDRFDKGPVTATEIWGGTGLAKIEEG